MGKLTNINIWRRISESIPNKSCSLSDASWSFRDCVFRLDRRRPYSPMANCTAHTLTNPTWVNWTKTANSDRLPELRWSEMRAPSTLVWPRNSTWNSIVAHSSNRIPHPIKWSPVFGRLFLKKYWLRNMFGFYLFWFALPRSARKRIRNRLVEIKALRYRLMQMWIEADPAPSQFEDEVKADYLATKKKFAMKWLFLFKPARYVASTKIIFISILFAWNVKWKMRVRSLSQTRIMG